MKTKSPNRENKRKITKNDNEVIDNVNELRQPKNPPPPPLINKKKRKYNPNPTISIIKASCPKKHHVHINNPEILLTKELENILKTGIIEIDDELAKFLNF